MFLWTIKIIGLHTNGYSLARKVLLEKFNVTDRTDYFEKEIGEELLTVHKSYLHLIETLKSVANINAFSHITGGGIIGNTKRVTPKNLTLKIDWDAWDVLPIFKLIQDVGKISDEEMRNVFNMGIGLIAVVDKDEADLILETALKAGEKGYVMGVVE